MENLTEFSAGEAERWKAWVDAMLSAGRDLADGGRHPALFRARELVGGRMIEGSPTTVLQGEVRRAGDKVQLYRRATGSLPESLIQEAAL